MRNHLEWFSLFINPWDISPLLYNSVIGEDGALYGTNKNL